MGTVGFVGFLDLEFGNDSEVDQGELKFANVALVQLSFVLREILLGHGAGPRPHANVVGLDVPVDEARLVQVAEWLEQLA